MALMHHTVGLGYGAINIFAQRFWAIILHFKTNANLYYNLSLIICLLLKKVFTTWAIMQMYGKVEGPAKIKFSKVLLQAVSTKELAISAQASMAQTECSCPITQNH